MSIRNRYKVVTKHPTGYLDGTRIMVVYLDDCKLSSSFGKRHVDSADLGCSRDYAAKDDEEAIRMFLPEHAMKAVSIKKTK